MATLTNTGPDLITLGDVREDGTPDIAEVRFQFPVPHGRMRIRQTVKIDQEEIPGRSGKVKQATGYEDAEIEVHLVLVDEEDKAGVVRSAIDHFRELQRAFRDRGTQDALPRVFSIASRLTDACEIKTVLFQGIEVADAPGNNDLDVTIAFVEFEPIELQVEKQALAAAARTDAAAEAEAAADRAGLESELGAEANPLVQAFQEGRAAAMGGPYEGERPGDDPEANGDTEAP